MSSFYSDVVFLCKYFGELYNSYSYYVSYIFAKKADFRIESMCNPTNIYKWKFARVFEYVCICVCGCVYIYTCKLDHFYL